jgi:hypothetical protein
MKLPIFLAYSFILLSVGCGIHHDPTSETKDRFILESYDASKGYTFLRPSNGVHYQTNCLYYPHVTGSSTKMPATDEGACSDILPYLHQPYLVLDTATTDRLIFRADIPGTTKADAYNEYTIEFKIVEAK